MKIDYSKPFWPYEPLPKFLSKKRKQKLREKERNSREWLSVDKVHLPSFKPLSLMAIGKKEGYDNKWLGGMQGNVFHSQMEWDIPSSIAEIDVRGQMRGCGFNEQCFQSIYSNTEV